MKKKKDVLERIILAKRREVEFHKANIPEEALLDSTAARAPKRSMKEALLKASPYGIIAEFKRKSPSGGFINRDADVEKIIAGYAACGAAACSVLTDPAFFAGSAADLRKARKAADIPILRKDFIIDPYQLAQAAAWGADAVLLIAAALEKERCRYLAARAHKLGLEVLLEIHGQDELDHLGPDVDMAGVNNRNLKDLSVDTGVSLSLAGMIPDGYVKVSESGIESVADVARLYEAGYRGFLVGGRFMRGDDPASELKTFLADVG